MINVAVFPAGSEIGLEINRALKYSIHINLFGISSMPDHARCVYKNYTGDMPLFRDPSFFERLNAYIDENKINYIYPALDDVQLFLTENSRKINSFVITSDLDTVRICRSKLLTYDYLREEDFIPRFLPSSEIDTLQKNDFPLFIKPDKGQGSKNAFKVSNKDELLYLMDKDDEFIICEYLPGEEFTIDCFSDFHGSLRKCIMRNRKRIKSGISVNSQVLDMPENLYRIAAIINAKFKLNGAWFFQVKLDKNQEYKLMEIAPRVSGTMGLSRNLGVNFPLLSVFNFMKKETKIIQNHFQIEVDRALFSRYITNLEYNNVYIDFDDTLVLKGRVNKCLMMFLYQSVNQGKKVYLLTKHINDIYQSLKNNRIHINLFEDIMQISKDDEKINFIKEQESIFIDDSFSERFAVSTALGIPVFDCSEVECLLDWRE